LHLQCSISMSSGSCAGILLREFRGEGIAILLDFDNQCIQIGLAGNYNPLWGWSCMVQDTCRRPLERGKSYHLRCFARDEHFEVYLDNRWVFTTVIAESPRMGDVQLCVERGEAKFAGLRLARIESLA